MLTGLIILFFWVCLSGLIYIIIRNKKDALSFPQILFFFACKIIAGEVYGYIFKRFYHGDDTWALNNDSILQYKRLLQSPLQFIKDVFSDTPVPENDEFHHFASYLETLEYAIVTKTMAIFNLISQGNYYINVVFFNFLGFFGVYFFYKLLAAQLDKQHLHLAAIVLFLFPPALFWLSGIRTEGLLLLFTGILLYLFNRWMKEKKIIDALVCLSCFGMAVILRNGFAVLIVPPLIAWWVVHAYKTRTSTTFLVTYAICIFAAVAGSFLLPANLNVFSIIALRQHEFMGLQGNTRFALTPLTANPLSFIKVLPESLLNTFIRPFMWEAKGLLQWFSSIENIVVLMLLIASFINIKRSENGLRNASLAWVLLVTGLCNYIVIGCIVPFPGAIVRYKIIPELFLVGACLIAFLPDNYSRKD